MNAVSTPTREQVVQALLAEVSLFLEGSAFGTDAMRCRERLAALMYQLGMWDMPPDYEIEVELLAEGLVLRRTYPPGYDPEDDAEGRLE